MKATNSLCGNRFASKWQNDLYYRRFQWKHLVVRYPTTSLIYQHKKHAAKSKENISKPNASASTSLLIGVNPRAWYSKRKKWRIQSLATDMQCFLFLSGSQISFSESVKKLRNPAIFALTQPESLVDLVSLGKKCNRMEFLQTPFLAFIKRLRSTNSDRVTTWNQLLLDLAGIVTP